MKAFITVFTLLFFCPTSSSAQTSITGYAISLDTADTIPEAIVFLKDEQSLTILGREPVTTDENGYYEFTDVPPGKYQISASARFPDKIGEKLGILLVSRIFPVTEEGEEIHFGFSVASQKASNDLHDSMVPLGLYEEQKEPGPVRFSGIPELLIVRKRLVRSSIRDHKWNEILNISLPERLVDL